MALYKVCVSENGVETRYHRIKEICLDKDGKVDIMVYSYASQEYRENETDNRDQSQVISFQTYYFNVGKPSISYKEAYDLLKTMPEFSRAEDILEK